MREFDGPDRVGIIDQQSTGKRRDKDLTQRTQSAQRARRSEMREFDGPDRAGSIDRRRKKIGARFSGCCPESAISCPYRGTGERRQTSRKKKKGESRETATRPTNIIPD